MNSSDEDDSDMKPDELTEMYTSEMDPKKGPIKLTQAQVAEYMPGAILGLGVAGHPSWTIFQEQE
jgi:hypothetical protein